LSWHALAVGINTKFDTDTGAGGLANSGIPLVTGYWNLEAPQQAEAPYIVLSPTTNVEVDTYTSGDHVEIDFDAAIYSSKDQGTDIPAQVAARVRALLHRQTLTLGSGWTLAGFVLRTGSTGPIVDDQIVQQVEFYKAVLVKS